MDRIERQYYPDGTLREEVHYRGTRAHGPWRVWHPNGILAEEYFFENGVYVNGVMRTWDERGTLRSEVSFVNEKQIGRAAVYNEGGSILCSNYYLESGEVSREEHDQACVARPELPRYTDSEPPSKQRRRNPKPAPMRPSPAAIARNRTSANQLFASESAEALDWLKSTPTGSTRNLGELADVASICLVTHLYSLGAARVIAVQIETIPGTESQTTNHILVQLPTAPEARERLFAFEAEHADSEGFDPDPDRGQDYIYLKLC